MLTVASPMAPALTRASGIVPNSSSTLSSSSSTVSWVALMVKGLDISPALKVTLEGTPE